MSDSSSGSAALPDRPVAVQPTGPVDARLTAPASKSHTNRLLAIAALADGTTTLHEPLDSDDSQAMRALARALGAEVDDTDPGRWQVRGVAGRPPGGTHAHVRASGTALRFGAALACLSREPIVVDGDAQLRRRPVGALIAALMALGATIHDEGGYPPIRAGGGLPGGAVDVDCAGSSQFASAVLLAAPYAARDIVVGTRGLGAPAYVELTTATMRECGADVERLLERDAEGLDAGPAWRVRAGVPYAPGERRVEHDASAAAHLWALAAATGGRVTVTNVGPTVQPDAAVPALLEEMGCTVEVDGAAVTVLGPQQLRPLEADLSATPDQVTTFASLAALAHGTSRLSGLAVVRGHESDRLAALARELPKLGVAVDEQPDGLLIHGPCPPPPQRRVLLDPHDDHRLAMAFAALAARLPGVVVGTPSCVAKTHPRFWQDLAAAGVAVRTVAADDEGASPSPGEPLGGKPPSDR